MTFPPVSLLSSVFNFVGKVRVASCLQARSLSASVSLRADGFLSLWSMCFLLYKQYMFIRKITIPKNFQYMVKYSIYSVLCYFDLTVLLYFLNSHQVSHRRYEFGVRLLPDLFGWGCTFHRVRKCHIFSVFRSLAVRLHHLHLRSRCRSLSGSGRL